jgi:hypothetical protein
MAGRTGHRTAKLLGQMLQVVLAFRQIGLKERKGLGAALQLFLQLLQAHFCLPRAGL